MKGIFYDLNLLKAVLKKAGLGGEFMMIRYREDWPIPKIAYPRQVLVKTRLGGICAGDMHQINVSLPYSASIIASKQNPFPMGHELVGDVVEIGSEVNDLRVGQKVVFSPIAHCAAYGFEPCARCQEGHLNTCQAVTGIGDGSQLEQLYGGRNNFGGFAGGGFSEYVVAFEKQLTLVPEDLPDRVAVLAEPFTIGLHAVGRRLPADNETALVIGGGIIGLMTIAAIRALKSKCRIVLLARYPFQEEAARRLGVNEVITDRDSTLIYEKVGELVGGRLIKPLIGKKIAYGETGADIVFDTVGTDTSIDDALRLVRCNGTVVLIGMAFGITKKTEWALQVYKELDVLGAINSGIEKVSGESLDTFALAVRLLDQNPERYAHLVTHTYPIHAFKTAFRAFKNKRTNHAIKSVFDFAS